MKAEKLKNSLKEFLKALRIIDRLILKRINRRRIAAAGIKMLARSGKECAGNRPEISAE